MPYSAEHKAKTRARICEAARRLFNRKGFEATTIDEIMAEAGLTRGGFYNHFSAKEALYAEAVAGFAGRSPFAQRLASRPEPDPVRRARLLVELYLSDGAIADADMHCPLYALPSDISRSGPVPRAAYTEVVRRMRGVLAAACGGDEERAMTVLSLCVGAMLLARTSGDPALGSMARRGALAQALALLPQPGPGAAEAA